MDVIGHHHEITHAISIAVEAQQRVAHDLRQIRSPKDATAVASIEKVLSAAIKLSQEGFALGRSQF